MEGSLTISGRQLGRKQPLFEDWTVPYPPDLNDGGGPVTLRALITRIVCAEIGAFRKRQEDRRLIRALTARQMEDAAKGGKIASGGSELLQSVDDEHAVAAALQAFEDGLYLVIVDQQQERELDRQVFLRPDSRVTFLRLVMLAGG